MSNHTENDSANSNNSDVPKVGHASIPLWIKIMWLLGVSWVVGYIFWGVQHNPKNW